MTFIFFPNIFCPKNSIVFIVSLIFSPTKTKPLKFNFLFFINSIDSNYD